MESQSKVDKLAYVAQRFMQHSEIATTSDSPLIVDSAKRMCSIDIWEMWILTQEK